MPRYSLGGQIADRLVPKIEDGESITYWAIRRQETD